MWFSMKGTICKLLLKEFLVKIYRKNKSEKLQVILQFFGIDRFIESAYRRKVRGMAIE